MKYKNGEFKSKEKNVLSVVLKETTASAIYILYLN